MSTDCFPAASNSSATSAVARASPPRNPRVAIERMKIPVSLAWPCMRIRSPRIAPPVNGLLGSTAIIPPPVGRRQAVHQRALSRSRRAGNPGQVALSGVRENAAQDLFRFGMMILNCGDRAGDGADVAREDLFDPGVNR